MTLKRTAVLKGVAVECGVIRMFDNRFLVRIDSKNTHGWYVKITKPGNAKPIATKLFSDKKLGGSGIALASASLWRDQMADKLSVDLAPRCLAHTRDKRSRTDVVGVFFTGDAKEKSTRVNCKGQAMLNGVLHRKSWSVKKWGYAGAWRRAVEFRHGLTGFIEYTAGPPPPEKWIIEWAQRFEIDLTYNLN